MVRGGPRRPLRVLAIVAAVVVSLLPGGGGGAAEPPRPFGVESRAAHIAGALNAVAEASPIALKEGLDYARVLDRGACSGGAQRLRVECLVVAVQRYCRDRGEVEARRCALYMDVIVSNVLADRRLIPPDRRYQIVRENADYRPALARELRRIQGTLAVDFRLRTGDAEDVPTMALNIDRYCLAGVDDARFPYQACVSALVWFIKGPQ
jgi:hypothetical protein